MAHTVKKWVCMLLCALVCLISIPALAFGPSDEEIYRGIDVSQWQGEIDFQKVKGDGIEMVYIRSSVGNQTIDRYFEQNYRRAKEAGLLVGVYHNVTATNAEEARRQARFFASVIRQRELDCKPAMDFETFNGLSTSQINEISRAFLQTLAQETGEQPIIYANAYTARRILAQDLSKYPLWVAEWGVSQPQANGKWDSWIAWQYSDAGRIAGISGRVDLNQFTKGVLRQSDTPSPTPTPPPDAGYFNYTVRRGDTLWDIAQRYGTTVSELVRLNNIQNPSLIHPGQVLRIPKNQNNGSGQTPPGSTRTYTIRRGDTLWDIAQRYGTTVSGLVRLNNIQNPNIIYPGEVIHIPINHAVTTVYTVRRGDTLSGIAKRFNTTVNAIARLNNIKNVNRITAGQRLLIPLSGSGGTSQTRYYTVRRGDTLSDIAKRYNTTVSRLVRINGIKDPNRIYPGQRLQV